MHSTSFKVLLILFSFMQVQVLDAQTTTEENKPSLYHFPKVLNHAGRVGWSYSSGSHIQIDEVISTCHLCESKYPKHRKQIEEIRKSLTQKKAVWRKQLLQLQREWHELEFSGKLARLKKNGVEIELAKVPTAFAQTAEGENFLSKSYPLHHQWIHDQISSKGPELKSILKMERLRYSVASLGLIAALQGPAFQEVVQVKGEKRQQLRNQWDQNEKTYSDRGNQFIKKSFYRILNVLNRSQIQKLERRTGLIKEHFFQLMNYYSVPDFLQHLSVKESFEVKVSERNYKKYLGIPGLEKLSKELGSNTKVRYHITEAAPSKKPLSKTHLHNFYYRGLIEHNTPINQVSRTFVSPYIRPERGPVWLLEPSVKQQTQLTHRIAEWQAFYKNKSIKEKIELNNQLLEDLELIYTKRQGLGLFRGFFQKHGLLAFFFLPGVKSDFQLSDHQIRKLKLISKEETEKIREFQKEFNVLELETIYSVFSKAERLKIQKATGISIKEMIAERAEFQKRRCGSPLYAGNHYKQFQIQITPYRFTREFQSQFEDKFQNLLKQYKKAKMQKK